jgi:hypothetical protein
VNLVNHFLLMGMVTPASLAPQREVKDTFILLRPSFGVKRKKQDRPSG